MASTHLPFLYEALPWFGKGSVKISGCTVDMIQWMAHRLLGFDGLAELVLGCRHGVRGM
jgi:hypothetical protein